MRRETVTVGGKPLEMRWNFAAQYMFEEVTGGLAFDAGRTMHRHLMYWCMLSACNGDGFGTDFDGFMEELNRSPLLEKEIEEAFLAILKDRSELMAAETAALKKKD